MNYTTLSDPQNLIQTDWAYLAPTSGATMNVLQLGMVDGAGVGSVSFRATATLKGGDWNTISPAAMYRLICLGLLWHLDEQSLTNACESLVDIYVEQRDRGLHIERARPELRWIPVSGLDRVERNPFQFQDE
jgi:hypothetical protein